MDEVLVVQCGRPHLGRLALYPAVDIDTHDAGVLVVSAGDVIPVALLEDLRVVASGEFAESDARTVELQLFALEVRVADTQQRIVLLAHHGRNAHRIAGMSVSAKSSM